MLRFLLIGLFLASAASGQVIYRTEFHSDHGWTFDAPEVNTSWKVDALPAATPNGPFRSPPYSLNYNDDTFYYDLERFTGNHARSPMIDLGAAVYEPVLTFWCNNQMAEPMCDNHESYQMKVIQGPTTLLHRCLTCENCYQNQARISPCDYDAWHKHTLPLQKSWGVVQIDFFPAGDSIFNQAAGAFVDDLTVFDAEPPMTYCSGKANSQGCTPQVEYEGVPEFTPGGPFVLRAPNALNQQAGLLFYSLAGPDMTPHLGGTLCVQPPLVRTPVTTTGGDPPPTLNCSGELEFDFNAWIASGNDPNLLPGVRVYAQFFYRDPADPFATGLTDGISFVILP